MRTDVVVLSISIGGSVARSKKGRGMRDRRSVCTTFARTRQRASCDVGDRIENRLSRFREQGRPGGRTGEGKEAYSRQFLNQRAVGL